MGLEQMGKGHNLDTRKCKSPKKEEWDFSRHVTGRPRGQRREHQLLVTKEVHAQCVCTQQDSSSVFCCNDHITVTIIFFINRIQASKT